MPFRRSGQPTLWPLTTLAAAKHLLLPAGRGFACLVKLRAQPNLTFGLIIYPQEKEGKHSSDTAPPAAGCAELQAGASNDLLPPVPCTCQAVCQAQASLLGDCAGAHTQGVNPPLAAGLRRLDEGEGAAIMGEPTACWPCHCFHCLPLLAVKPQLLAPAAAETMTGPASRPLTHDGHAFTSIEAAEHSRLQLDDAALARPNSVDCALEPAVEELQPLEALRGHGLQGHGIFADSGCTCICLELPASRHRSQRCACPCPSPLQGIYQLVNLAPTGNPASSPGQSS